MFRIVELWAIRLDENEVVLIRMELRGFGMIREWICQRYGWGSGGKLKVFKLGKFKQDEGIISKEIYFHPKIETFGTQVKFVCLIF